MKQARTIWFLAVFYAIGLLGCSEHRPAPVTPVPTPTNPVERTFFWRIDSPDARDRPSYLLGTMHIGVDPYDALPSGIWRKFDAAEVFVMEVDTTGPDTLGLGMQPEGSSLDQQMTAAQWRQLRAALDLDDAEADKLKRVKPWLLVVHITQELAPPARSIEDVFQARARDAGKRLAFLESVKVQEAMLDQLIDVRYLLAFASDLDRHRRSLARDANIYRTGDDDALYQSSIADLEKRIGADKMERLVYKRNRDWIPPLERLLAAGDAFIAVGASHLVGDRSVIALLRERGYIVSRIPE